MLLEVMGKQISLTQYLVFFIRLAAAGVCGAAIGVERGHRLKEAGVRTHLLVSCTAALIIIISKYGFTDLANAEVSAEWGVRGADPARLAAQVVSGISFLCAGVIFKQGSSVKGLTTAAGLWATAGIGLALGAGMFPLGIFSTVGILLVQIVMHRVPFLNDQYQNHHIEITVQDDAGFRRALMSQLKEWNAQVVESSIILNQDNTTSYAMEIKMNNSIKQEEIYAFLEQHSSVTAFKQTING